MRKLGILLLMPVCGVFALAMATFLLIQLGLALHHNYEYYGLYGGGVLVYGSGAIGFLAPAVVAYLLNQKRPWQFSLRTLLIAATVIAVAVGAIVAMIR
jgi:hypothetical protein